MIFSRRPGPKASSIRVFCSSSCALAEPVAGLAAAERLTLSTCAVAGEAAQARHDEGVRAHVRRLLLHPDDFVRVGMGVDSGFELGFGPGVELRRGRRCRWLSSLRFARSTRSSWPILPVQISRRCAFVDRGFGQDVLEARPGEVCDGRRRRRDGAACSWA